MNLEETNRIDRKLLTVEYSSLGIYPPRGMLVAAGIS